MKERTVADFAKNHPNMLLSELCELREKKAEERGRLKGIREAMDFLMEQERRDDGWLRVCPTCGKNLVPLDKHTWCCPCTPDLLISIG